MQQEQSICQPMMKNYMGIDGAHEHQDQHGSGTWT